MVDRLRLLLDRPLRDSDRPRLFAFAVGVIVAAAAVLALVVTPGPRPRPRRPAAARPRHLAHRRRPRLPRRRRRARKEGRARTDRLPPRDRARQARGEAVPRGYLRFAYGQAPPGAITGAAPPLRRALAKARPRVPMQERRRRPRVLLVQTDERDAHARRSCSRWCATAGAATRCRSRSLGRRRAGASPPWGADRGARRGSGPVRPAPAALLGLLALLALAARPGDGRLRGGLRAAAAAGRLRPVVERPGGDPGAVPPAVHVGGAAVRRRPVGAGGHRRRSRPDMAARPLRASARG